MTEKQFKELKKLLEAVQTNLKSIDKNVLKTFNTVNQTSMYVGADEGKIQELGEVEAKEEV